MAYETTRKRIGWAIAAGVLGGTLLMQCAMILPDAIASWGTPDFMPVSWGDAARQMLLTFVFIGVVFTFFLVTVGGPFWVVFHRLGWRSWRAAMLLGGIASFTVSLLVIVAPIWMMALTPGSTYSAADGGIDSVVNNHITSHGWALYLTQSAYIAAAGALTGWLIWRVAYRKAVVLRHRNSAALRGSRSARRYSRAPSERPSASHRERCCRTRRAACHPVRRSGLHDGRQNRRCSRRTAPAGGNEGRAVSAP
jgi:hypothetical protein